MPGAENFNPLSEARRAVTLARMVRRHVRSMLPKQALRWGKP
jgi:hypothetical protein